MKQISYSMNYVNSWPFKLHACFIVKYDDCFFDFPGTHGSKSKRSTHHATESHEKHRHMHNTDDDRNESIRHIGDHLSSVREVNMIRSFREKDLNSIIVL